MKKFLWITGSLLFVVLMLFLFRTPILRGMGNYLIASGEPQKSDVMFVLSGSPIDRGNEAAKLYKEGWSGKIVCTGGNQSRDLMAVGMHYFESQLTALELKRSGIPDSAVQIINEGTSTWEESDVALNYCKRNDLHSCIIVSSDFHTR